MNNSNHSKKKLILSLLIAIVVLLPAVLLLARNKRKINETNRPTDRSRIPVAVTVATASIIPLNDKEQYPALVQPSEEAKVYAQTSGLIAHLYINLGKHVKKGQVIGRLDTRILEINLKNALVDLKSSEINKAKKLEDYNRAKDLYENKAGLEVNMLTAKSDYENAANTYENKQLQVNLAQRQLANADVTAPLSGIISTHLIKEGEYVTPGSAIATVANITVVKTTVYVDQQMSYKLKEGQSATIYSTLFGDKQFNGKVIFISPVADASHNYQVDLLVTPTLGLYLKGGTDVQVTFDTGPEVAALSIPKTALMSDAKDPYVFTIKDGSAKMRIIKTGRIQGDKVEVLSGLNKDEIVITSGQINLKEGSNLRIIK